MFLLHDEQKHTQRVTQSWHTHTLWNTHMDSGVNKDSIDWCSNEWFSRAVVIRLTLSPLPHWPATHFLIPHTFLSYSQVSSLCVQSAHCSPPCTPTTLPSSSHMPPPSAAVTQKHLPLSNFTCPCEFTVWFLTTSQLCCCLCAGAWFWSAEQSSLSPVWIRYGCINLKHISYLLRRSLRYALSGWGSRVELLLLLEELSVLGARILQRIVNLCLSAESQREVGVYLESS